MENKRKNQYKISPVWEDVIVRMIAFGMTFCYVYFSGSFSGKLRSSIYAFDSRIILLLTVYLVVEAWRTEVLTPSEIKIYRVGIRIRRVPWSSVKRLVFLKDGTENACKVNYYLLVELKGCIPSCPETWDKEKVKSFWWKNPTTLIKIRLHPKEALKQIEQIEQVRQIDVTYTWSKQK